MKLTEAKAFQTYAKSHQQYEKHPDAFTGGVYMLSMQLLIEEVAEEEMKQQRLKNKALTLNIPESKFSSNKNAAEALEIMKDIEKAYGYITLSDYYETCCNTNEKHYVHDYYGWTDLSNAEIRLSNGYEGKYTISMPPIKNIEKEIKELSRNGK